MESTRPTLKHRWIKFLLSRDEKPALQILEWTIAANADERERHWIRHFDAQLGTVNITHGSRKGLRQTRFRYLDMIENIDPQIDELPHLEDIEDMAETDVPPMSELKTWDVDQLTNLRNQLERETIQLWRMRSKRRSQLEAATNQLAVARTELDLWHSGRLQQRDENT